jgi:hypothetical protein
VRFFGYARVTTLAVWIICVRAHLCVTISGGAAPNTGLRFCTAFVPNP